MEVFHIDKKYGFTLNLNIKTSRKCPVLLCKGVGLRLYNALFSNLFIYRFHSLVPETFVFIRQNKCLVGILVAVMGARVCVQYSAGNCNGTVSETTESELGGRVGIGNACGNKGECGTQDAGEHQQ